MPSVLVELAHNIIEKEHRLLAEHILDNRRLGKLASKDNRALLPLTSIVSRILSLDVEADLVGVRPNDALSAGELLAAALFKGGSERITGLISRKRSNPTRCFT